MLESRFSIGKSRVLPLRCCASLCALTIVNEVTVGTFDFFITHASLVSAWRRGRGSVSRVISLQFRDVLHEFA